MEISPLVLASLIGGAMVVGVVVGLIGFMVLWQGLFGLDCASRE